MQIFNLAEELEKERKKNKELEKEINRLTAESTHYESKYYNEAKKVDKAIEYINVLKETTPSSPRKDYAKMILINYGDLLDILKGDNK